MCVSRFVVLKIWVKEIVFNFREGLFSMYGFINFSVCWKYMFDSVVWFWGGDLILIILEVSVKIMLIILS